MEFIYYLCLVLKIKPYGNTFVPRVITYGFLSL